MLLELLIELCFIANSNAASIRELHVWACLKFKKRDQNKSDKRTKFRKVRVSVQWSIIKLLKILCSILHDSVCLSVHNTQKCIHVYMPSHHNEEEIPPNRQFTH